MLVNINTIKPGDTVRYNGDLRTVCRGDIKRDSFMGITLFGDCFRLGNQPVERVIIKGAV